MTARRMNDRTGRVEKRGVVQQWPAQNPNWTPAHLARPVSLGRQNLLRKALRSMRTPAR